MKFVIQMTEKDFTDDIPDFSDEERVKFNQIMKKYFYYGESIKLELNLDTQEIKVLTV